MSCLPGGVPQSDVAARKTLLRLSEAAWADALVEMALCERDLEERLSLSGVTATASSDDTASVSLTTKVRFHVALVDRLTG